MTNHPMLECNSEPPNFAQLCTNKHCQIDNGHRDRDQRRILMMKHMHGDILVLDVDNVDAGDLVDEIICILFVSRFPYRCWVASLA